MCRRQPGLGLPVALCDIIQISYFLPDTRCLSQITVGRPGRIRDVDLLALFAHVLDILRNMDEKDLRLAVSRNRVRFIVSNVVSHIEPYTRKCPICLPTLVASSLASVFCPLDRLPMTLRCLIWMLHSHFQQWCSFPTSRFSIKGQD